MPQTSHGIARQVHSPWIICDFKLLFEDNGLIRVRTAIFFDMLTWFYLLESLAQQDKARG